MPCDWSKMHKHYAALFILAYCDVIITHQQRRTSVWDSWSSWFKTQYCSLRRSNFTLSSKTQYCPRVSWCRKSVLCHTFDMNLNIKFITAKLPYQISLNKLAESEAQSGLSQPVKRSPSKMIRCAEAGGKITTLQRRMLFLQSPLQTAYELIA